MTFYTSLPENRSVRLSIKNLGRRMPERAVREELESLVISVQGVVQLRSGRRDQDQSTDRFSFPLSIVSVAQGPQVAKVRSLTERCGLQVTVETYEPPKGPLQCKRCQRFVPTQRNCGHTTRCVACCGVRLSGDFPSPRGHSVNYRVCAAWKDSSSALAGRTPGGDSGHQIPAGIQDEIRLKNRLRRRWQVTRDPALKAEVNRLNRSVTRQLNEWRNDR